MNKVTYQSTFLRKYISQTYVWLFFMGLMMVSACTRPAITKLQESNFYYLDTKFKLDYKTETDQSNAKVKIRMRKDSLIWASITGPLNIEGIRTIITKDSIYLIDRINKTYIEADFDTLTRLLKFEVDYSLLQAIVLGDMPIPVYNAENVSTEGKLLKIRQEKEGIEILNYINPKTNKLEKLHLQDMANGNQLEMEYGSYRRQKGHWLPQKSNIKVTYQDKNTKQIQKTEVKLEYGKASITDTPITFPFSVPPKYRQN